LSRYYAAGHYTNLFFIKEPFMSRKVCLLAAMAVFGAMVLVMGCSKNESPKVEATSNDLFKNAHESVTELKDIIAKGNAPQTRTAINDLADTLGVLPGWLTPGKGNLEERKKYLKDAQAILAEEVSPLTNASPIDQAAVNAKLDEVDKLISQAE
jgi:cytochrome c556